MVSVDYIIMKVLSPAVTGVVLFHVFPALLALTDTALLFLWLVVRRLIGRAL